MLNRFDNAALFPVHPHPEGIPGKLVPVGAPAIVQLNISLTYLH
jgi:hypothetical protein